MKKRILLVTLAVCLAMSLAACKASSKSETTAQATETTTKAPETTVATTEAKAEETTEAVKETQTEEESKNTASSNKLVSETMESVPETPAPVYYPTTIKSYENPDMENIRAKYPSLAKRGSVTEDNIGGYFEAVSDLLFYIPEEAAYYEIGNSVIQLLYNFGEEKTEIIESVVSKGNSLLDPVMKKVGYKDYQVTYYYDYGIFAVNALPGPVLALLEIDGKQYEYYYDNDELIYRYGPDGESYSPEVNEFMQDIYKVGCFYK
ncbi:MAG: hypothetical protein Q4B67_01060 [Eubacteriales bacterium]|nr:hypothetical protein [Eubacteriales bacterium]